MDFEEFALAVGVSPKIIDALEDCFNRRTPVDRIVHERMMKAFRLYLTVGGMPAAVSKYIETNNMRLVEMSSGLSFDCIRKTSRNMILTINCTLMI